MSGEYVTQQLGGVTVTALHVPVALPAPVATVTRRQALRALNDAGLLNSVENAINAMTGPAGVAARIDWDNATEFRRDFPLLAQLASALGLTSAQVDALFAAAAAID